PDQAVHGDPSTRRHGVVVGHLALEIAVLGHPQAADGAVVAALLRRAWLEPGRLRALDRLGVHPLALGPALVHRGLTLAELRATRPLQPTIGPLAPGALGNPLRRLGQAEEVHAVVDGAQCDAQGPGALGRAVIPVNARQLPVIGWCPTMASHAAISLGSNPRASQTFSHHCTGFVCVGSYSQGWSPIANASVIASVHCVFVKSRLDPPSITKPGAPSPRSIPGSSRQPKIVPAMKCLQSSLLSRNPCHFMQRDRSSYAALNSRRWSSLSISCQGSAISPPFLNPRLPQQVRHRNPAARRAAIVVRAHRRERLQQR